MAGVRHTRRHRDRRLRGVAPGVTTGVLGIGIDETQEGYGCQQLCLVEGSGVCQYRGGQKVDFRRQYGAERVVVQTLEGEKNSHGVTAFVPGTPERQGQGAI